MRYISIVFLIILLAGCHTVDTGSASSALDISIAGSAAAGRLEQVYRQLTDIAESERNELGNISNTASDLAETIQRLVDFAFGLLDEIDAIRAGINPPEESD